MKQLIETILTKEKKRKNIFIIQHRPKITFRLTKHEITVEKTTTEQHYKITEIASYIWFWILLQKSSSAGMAFLTFNLSVSRRQRQQHQWFPNNLRRICMFTSFSFYNLCGVCLITILPFSILVGSTSRSIIFHVYKNYVSFDYIYISCFVISSNCT